MNKKHVGRPRGGQLLTDPTYTPSRLLNWLQEQFEIQSDVGLAKSICMHKELISKIRNRHREISAEFLLSCHERFGVPVQKMRDLAGMPSKF